MRVPATVLTTIDRYLLRQIALTWAVMTGIGLAILVLERVLRLFSLVANPNKAFSYVGQMLVFLLPHYLSIALPAALFFGVLLTFLRLKRDSELVVLSAAGQSLGRLLAPVMGLSVVMMLIAAVIVGFLSPHARYAYRAIKQEVAEASLTAAVLGGTFIHADGLTFFAETSTQGADGLHLGRVFVHQPGNDGGSVVVTGANGLLGQAPESGVPVLVLERGLRAEIAADGRPSTLTFSGLSWPVTAGVDDGFRPRGGDQRELTLTELWTARATPTSEPSAAEIAAELHARLVLIASVPLLPLLAAPLALAGGQRTRRSGIVIGLVILIAYHEILGFGEALAKRDLLAPALGLWLPFLLFATGAAWLFGHAVHGTRPGFWRR